MNRKRSNVSIFSFRPANAIACGLHSVLKCPLLFFLKEKERISRFSRKILTTLWNQKVKPLLVLSDVKIQHIENSFKFSSTSSLCDIEFLKKF